MNRIAGIALAAIGLIVAVLSIVKLIPNLTATGVILIVLGGLVIGLSFINKPDPEDVDRMSTPSTLGNIFISPTEVFQNLRRHPRWLVALLIMSILSTAYANLFLYRLTPERVTNFAIDKTLEMPIMNDAAKEQVEAGRQKAIDDAKSPILRVGNAVNVFAGSVFGYAFLALIFFIFGMAMGGKINFWQAFSAAIYASFPVAVIRFVLNTTVLFLKDPDEIHPILGQQTLIQDNLNFLVAPSEHPVIFTLLGSFSILFFYWLWMNATGLKAAGERITGTIAWSAAITIFALIVFFGVAMSALFPSFIS